MTTRVLGQTVPKKDAATKVRGSRKFPQDFDMEGQLYAKVVWSDFPHARVKKVDISRAAPPDPGPPAQASSARTRAFPFLC